MLVKQGYNPRVADPLVSSSCLISVVSTDILSYSDSLLFRATIKAVEMKWQKGLFRKLDALPGNLGDFLRSSEVKFVPVCGEPRPEDSAVLIGIAGTICHLLVWAPSSWYRGGDSRPLGTQDILQCSLWSPMWSESLGGATLPGPCLSTCWYRSDLWTAGTLEVFLCPKLSLIMSLLCE